MVRRNVSTAVVWCAVATAAGSRGPLSFKYSEAAVAPRPDRRSTTRVRPPWNSGWSSRNVAQLRYKAVHSSRAPEPVHSSRAPEPVHSLRVPEPVHSLRVPEPAEAKRRQCALATINESPTRRTTEAQGKKKETTAVTTRKRRGGTPSNFASCRPPLIVPRSTRSSELRLRGNSTGSSLSRSSGASDWTSVDRRSLESRGRWSEESRARSSQESRARSSQESRGSQQGCQPPLRRQDKDNASPKAMMSRQGLKSWQRPAAVDETPQSTTQVQLGPARFRAPLTPRTVGSGPGKMQTITTRTRTTKAQGVPAHLGNASRLEVGHLPKSKMAPQTQTKIVTQIVRTRQATNTTKMPGRPTALPSQQSRNPDQGKTVADAKTRAGNNIGQTKNSTSMKGTTNQGAGKFGAATSITTAMKKGQAKQQSRMATRQPVNDEARRAKSTPGVKLDSQPLAPNRSRQALRANAGGRTVPPEATEQQTPIYQIAQDQTSQTTVCVLSSGQTTDDSAAQSNVCGASSGSTSPADLSVQNAASQSNGSRPFVRSTTPTRETLCGEPSGWMSPTERTNHNEQTAQNSASGSEASGPLYRSADHPDQTVQTEDSPSNADHTDQTVRVTQSSDSEESIGRAAPSGQSICRHGQQTMQNSASESQVFAPSEQTIFRQPSRSRDRTVTMEYTEKTMHHSAGDSKVSMSPFKSADQTVWNAGSKSNGSRPLAISAGRTYQTAHDSTSRDTVAGIPQLPHLPTDSAVSKKQWGLNEPTAIDNERSFGEAPKGCDGVSCVPREAGKNAIKAAHDVVAATQETAVIHEHKNFHVIDGLLPNVKEVKAGQRFDVITHINSEGKEVTGRRYRIETLKKDKEFSVMLERYKELSRTTEGTTADDLMNIENYWTEILQHSTLKQGTAYANDEFLYVTLPPSLIEVKDSTKKPKLQANLVSLLYEDERLHRAHFPVGFLSSYEHKEVVSWGGCSIVAHWVDSDGIDRAVKLFKRPKLRYYDLEIQNRGLVQALAKNNAHVAEIHEADRTNETGLIFMDWVEGKDMMWHQESFFGSRLRSGAVLRQLLGVLKDLHAAGYAYRDLKLDNILVSDPKTMHVKLTDFGLAARPGPWGFNGWAGSTGTAAPEVCKAYCDDNAPPYGLKCDIYSAAACWYSLFYGMALPRVSSSASEEEVIERGAQELSEPIDLPMFPAEPQGEPHIPSLDQALKELISAMLNPVADKRPSAEECLKHRFFELSLNSPATRSDLAQGSPARGHSAQDGRTQDDSLAKLFAMQVAKTNDLARQLGLASKKL